MALPSEHEVVTHLLAVDNYRWTLVSISKLVCLFVLPVFGAPNLYQFVRVPASCMND